MGMNREILRIALPNIISNITVPIMGIAGTMIAGHLGDSVATIGALAIGVSIFNFIYFNCSFTYYLQPFLDIQLWRYIDFIGYIFSIFLYKIIF